ncbi:DUF2513 domain-containing protein [Bacillus licheniformis]|uniref:DUF2513 domain-containing protein n=1 Tax=Bacillus licheniformis TaxID=1402 RepID=UPI0021C6BC7B|nr:DUF2513 domain-containing protein [Bacillus licheniformis]
MELKPDLVREVLLVTEKTGIHERLYYKDLYKQLDESKQYDPDDVAYTIKKLIEGGLIFGASDLAGYYVDELTYEGHEFLSNIRDNKVWEHTKRTIGKIGGASLSVIGTAAGTYLSMKAKELFGPLING